MSLVKIALPILLVGLIVIAEQGVVPLEKQPNVTREDIKASREKLDREMKLDTKRPWDGMDLTGPHALEKRPEPDQK